MLLDSGLGETSHPANLQENIKGGRTFYSLEGWAVLHFELFLGNRGRGDPGPLLVAFQIDS